MAKKEDLPRHYQVVCSASLEKLEGMVVKFMDEGYVPTGGVSSYMQTGEFIFMQALVRT